MKKLELTNTELFYLENFVSKNWQDFINNIVDKDNMSVLDKEINDILLELGNKIRTLRQKGKNGGIE